MSKGSNRTTARSISALAAASFFAVLVAAAAWACVPQPLLVTVQPGSSGPAGSSVTVAAVGFDSGRAEIRWNALDGELLSTAEGPDFSSSVNIPQVPDGLYHLVVVGRAPGGEIGNTRTVAFAVTTAGAPPTGVTPPRQPQPAAAAASRSAEPASSSANSVLLLVTGGGLGALGCLAGFVLSRRRPRPEPDGASQA